MAKKVKITTALIKELRERTSAGLMICKGALTEANGDIDEAIVWLRQQGILKSEAKAHREANEGICLSYISEHNTSGMIEVNCETDFVAKNEDFVNVVSDFLKEFVQDDNSELDTASLTLKFGENILVKRSERICNFDYNVQEYTHNNKTTVLVFGYGNDEDLRNVAMHIAAMKPKYATQDEIDADFIKAEKEILLAEALNENAKAVKPKPESIIEKIVEGRLRKQLKQICLVDQDYIKDTSLTVGQYLEANGSLVRSFYRYTVGE